MKALHIYILPVFVWSRAWKFRTNTFHARRVNKRVSVHHRATQVFMTLHCMKQLFNMVSTGFGFIQVDISVGNILWSGCVPRKHNYVRQTDHQSTLTKYKLQIMPMFQFVCLGCINIHLGFFPTLGLGQCAGGSRTATEKKPWMIRANSHENVPQSHVHKMELPSHLTGEANHQARYLYVIFSQINSAGTKRIGHVTFMHWLRCFYNCLFSLYIYISFPVVWSLKIFINLPVSEISFHPSISHSVRLLYIHQSSHLSTHSSIHHSTLPSIHPSIHPSIRRIQLPPFQNAWLAPRNYM